MTRLHPKAMAWARREARKRRLGYQTIINEVLLEKAGRHFSAHAPNLPGVITTGPTPKAT